MQEQNSVASKIRKFRKEKNMSQDELSERSGINVSTIKKYESGARNPKPDQLLKIATALGVSINVFMEFEITTISDVISLLIRMDEQTDMTWNGDKDSDGNFIPSTISLSFNDDKLNEVLSTYMKYREYQTLNTSSENTCEDSVDVAFENHNANVEDSKNRLLLFNDTLKKRRND